MRALIVWQPEPVIILGHNFIIHCHLNAFHNIYHYVAMYRSRQFYYILIIHSLFYGLLPYGIIYIEPFLLILFLSQFILLQFDYNMFFTTRISSIYPWLSTLCRHYANPISPGAVYCSCISSLQWRHNEQDSVSNHQPHDCLLNRLFGCRSKKTSKLRVTGLCAGNSPGTGEFPAQRASNAENVSIWWRHHDGCL